MDGKEIMKLKARMEVAIAEEIKFFNQQTGFIVSGVRVDVTEFRNQDDGSLVHAEYVVDSEITHHN